MKLFAQIAVAAAAPLSASAASADTVYLHAGRLIDPERSRVLTDQLVTITDGRVAEIVPWQAPPAGEPVIDWSRYTVLPGLIDLHTHLADGYGQTSDPAEPLKHSAAATILKGAEAARTMLLAGFTTVRDVGAYRGLSDVALRDAIANGEVEGPRMLVAGAYITVPGGGGAVTGMAADVRIPAEFRLGEVRDAAEARDRARYLLQHGADFIKLIATGAVLAIGSEPGALELSEAEMKAACDEAAAHGTYCIAHAHGAAGIKAAIRAGARSIEHASLIDEEGIALAKERGVWLDMDIYDGDWIEEVGTRDGWPAEYLRKNRETTDRQREGFRRAVKAGVKLSFGTDAGVYPYGLGARQFAYMVRFGMTPMQAIRSATSDAAAAMGLSADIGSIGPGRSADLIAVAGDPLADPSVLTRVVGVIKGGRVVRTPAGEP
jgi:imidazolonepropionase-like amidohydrolase